MDAEDVVSAGSATGNANDDAAPTIGLLESIVHEVMGSYINMALVLVITILLYKILRGRNEESNRSSSPPAPQLPKLRRDFTIQELKPFDGTQPDGRVLMAVDGVVYDVTKGKSFYGPGTLIFWCRICVFLTLDFRLWRGGQLNRLRTVCYKQWYIHLYGMYIYLRVRVE